MTEQSNLPKTRRCKPLPNDRTAVVGWVREHLGHLACDVVTASPALEGGQRAADAALNAVDISGYARRRSTVWPPSDRRASQLSPYIRHGLLSLTRVRDKVTGGSGHDRFWFEGELLWQDHCRHWYAVFGTRTRRPVAYAPAEADEAWPGPEPWWRDMECMRATLEELETDGWCVNQTRMWLAIQFQVRGRSP